MVPCNASSLRGAGFFVLHRCFTRLEHKDIVGLIVTSGGISHRDEHTEWGKEQDQAMILSSCRISVLFGLTIIHVLERSK
jgi:hypothetical protein